MNSDEIDTLRAENERFRDENDRLARRNVLLVLEIEQLRQQVSDFRAQRDEARRDLCYADEGWSFPDDVAREKANELGWDCFKEKP